MQNHFSCKSMLGHDDAGGHVLLERVERLAKSRRQQPREVLSGIR